MLIIETVDIIGYVLFLVLIILSLNAIEDITLPVLVMVVLTIVNVDLINLNIPLQMLIINIVCH